MGEERKIWDQWDGEPLLWFRRFTRFRLMVLDRTISNVFHQERAEQENSKKLEKTRKNTEPDGTWYKKAREWHWEDRAAAWDAFQVEEQERIIAQEKAMVLRSGFALMHKRIQELDRLTIKLIEMTDEEDKVWLPDVKSIGTGPDAQRVDLVNFNAPLFMLISKYMADIAAEMGERVKKKDITITELPPNVYQNFDADKDGTE